CCCGEGEQNWSQAHPEVLGVHVQLVAVQLGQLGKGGLDVVQVLDGLPEGGQHLLAVGTDLGVAEDSGGVGQVPEGGEEPLCPGVDDQQPGLGSAFGHIDLAPEAGDELLLFACPVHHGAGLRVACGTPLCSELSVGTELMLCPSWT
uniref:Uncharacterized protein n=1 Tax=Melopsittacus undulatus TaxID=13146 RepID=A0A8C6IQS7_MELUD